MSPHRPRTRKPYEVLGRGPALSPPPTRATTSAVDVVAQLEELAHLLDRGLLSRAEFDRQKRKVLGG